jgi:HD-GYP domain-containing protein (c-di-GMP phosphodiesterase class II)
MGPGSVVAGARASLRECADGLSDCSLYGEAAMPEEASTAESAIRLAAGRLRGRRSWQEQAVGRQARGVLLRVLEERGLAGGIDRLGVAAHAVAVGRRLGLSLSELDDVIRAAELQDLGKISVPAEILNKSGALGPEEWAVIRRHPLVGERILAGSTSLGSVARLVRSCYERWDGSGYPDGLVGEDIPLGARIIAVCVAFSAMTSARPYRAPMSPEEAVTQLRIASGSQFDPVVVDTFYLEIEPSLVLPSFALVS